MIEEWRPEYVLFASGITQQREAGGMEEISKPDLDHELN